MKVLFLKLVAWAKPYVLAWLTSKARTPDAEARFFPIRAFYWVRNKITGNLFLLTIGQSDFGGAAGSLPECRRDAERMDRRFAGYGARVRRFHNIGLVETRKAIQEALAELGDGKTVVIHYSSHGSQIGDRDGDEADRKDEVICAADLGLISDDELFAWCDAAVRQRGGKLVLILDTCHSGGMARASSAEVILREADAKFVPESMIPESALHEYRVHKAANPFPKVTEFRHTVLMATEEHNYAYDGVYTPAVDEILGDCGNMTAKELHDEACARLKARRARQVPQFAGLKDTRLFG